MLFIKGKNPKASLQVGRYTLANLKKVHLERIAIANEKKKIDEGTVEYKNLLKREEQNKAMQREQFSELRELGHSTETLVDIALHPDQYFF
jgi:hypothetical protein